MLVDAEAFANDGLVGQLRHAAASWRVATTSQTGTNSEMLRQQTETVR